MGRTRGSGASEAGARGGGEGWNGYGICRYNGRLGELGRRGVSAAPHKLQRAMQPLLHVTFAQGEEGAGLTGAEDTAYGVDECGRGKGEPRRPLPLRAGGAGRLVHGCTFPPPFQSGFCSSDSPVSVPSRTLRT